MGSKKILIVDDDPTIRELLLTALDDYTLSEASCGNEALKICKTEQPDLIILDVVLPDITGREVIKEIQKSSIYGKPDIIVITGMTDSLDDDSSEDHAEDAAKRLWQKAYGIIDFVSKPFDLRELRKTIEQTLS